MALDAALGLPGARPGVVTSLTRPTNPFIGQLIVETDTEQVRFYTPDGWWPLQREVQISSGAPMVAPDGYLWFDTIEGALYLRVNGAWELVIGDVLREKVFSTKGDLITYNQFDEVVSISAGTDGQVLTADSLAVNGLTWSTVEDTSKIALSIIEDQGDLIVGTGANTPARLPVGADNTLLVADSTATSGVEWKSEIFNTTINSPTISSGTISNSVVQGLQESWQISTAAVTGTVTIETLTSSAWYFTANASANFALNFRASSTVPLESNLAVGDSITIAVGITNGVNAYYPNSFLIDNSSVTPKWQGGAAPSSGNANSVDLYVFTIIKTSATPTFTVLASQTRFA